MVLYYLMFGLPFDAILTFIVSLVLFLTTDKTDTQKRHKLKSMLIMTACITGMTIVITFAFQIGFAESITEVLDELAAFLPAFVGYGAFFGLPPAAFAFFIVSLVKLCKTDKSNTQGRRKQKKLTIISGCIAGVTILAFFAIIVLVLLAFSHM